MRYRKKPVIIDAVRYGAPEDFHAVCMFVGYTPAFQGDSPWDSGFELHTLEGDMHASPGDWIIRGVRGEYYACKPEIFAETYELCRAD